MNERINILRDEAISVQDGSLKFIKLSLESLNIDTFDNEATQKTFFWVSFFLRLSKGIVVPFRDAYQALADELGALEIQS